jgi:hypothetical protein
MLMGYLLQSQYYFVYKLYCLINPLVSYLVQVDPSEIFSGYDNVLNIATCKLSGSHGE